MGSCGSARKGVRGVFMVWGRESMVLGIVEQSWFSEAYMKWSEAEWGSFYSSVLLSTTFQSAPEDALFWVGYNYSYKAGSLSLIFRHMDNSHNFHFPLGGHMLISIIIIVLEREKASAWSDDSGVSFHLLHACLVLCIRPIIIYYLDKQGGYYHASSIFQRSISNTNIISYVGSWATTGPSYVLDYMFKKKKQKQK